MTALDDIGAERTRQITTEGYTPEHDDAHERGELARAAATFAYFTSLSDNARKHLDDHPTVKFMWPMTWGLEHWKPKNRRRDLVRAGALIVAEIERLDRIKKNHFDIVFDGPPGPDAGRFVEVEDADGRSITLGKWLQRPDGYWVLRISKPS